MGLYQMLRGEHFFSHTLASLVIVGTIAALLTIGLLPGHTTVSPPSSSSRNRMKDELCGGR